MYNSTAATQGNANNPKQNVSIQEFSLAVAAIGGQDLNPPTSSVRAV